MFFLSAIDPQWGALERFRQEVGDENGGLAGEAAVVGIKPDGRRRISQIPASGKSFPGEGFAALLLEVDLPQAVVALDQEQLIPLAFLDDAQPGVAVGAGSEPDLSEAIDRLLPRDDRYRHAHGSPGHGADHVLPAWISPTLTVPVVDGELVLGTWQSIVLVDPNVDNRTRRVRLSFLAGGFGNWLYRRRVERLVADPAADRAQLAAQGGVSLAAAIGAFVGLTVLSLLAGMVPALLSPPG